VGGVYDMPVLQAVLDDTTIERVLEFPFRRLEVSVAVIVGLFIGREILQNLRKLEGEMRKYS
jgi:hypothetical protein